MKKKKNCLNCAFCVRNQDKFITYPHFINKKPFWSYSHTPLTNDERCQLLNNDDSFIGKEKRDFEEWVTNYDNKKENFDKQRQEAVKVSKNRLSNVGLSSIEPLVDIVDMVQNGQDVMSQFNQQRYSDYSKYGIKQPPPTNDYPDDDYLSCWKQHWNEKENKDLISNRNKLQTQCCKYFYDFRKMKNKTLELCDQERAEIKSDIQFITTIIVAGLTLIATIVPFIISLIKHINHYGA